MPHDNQLVEFRYLVMECCGHHLCWVNPRLPSYCPNCGRTVYPQVRSWAAFTDKKARLRTHRVNTPE